MKDTQKEDSLSTKDKRLGPDCVRYSKFLLSSCSTILLSKCVDFYHSLCHFLLVFDGDKVVEDVYGFQHGGETAASSTAEAHLLTH